jgi:hypothetical protein
LSLDQDAQRAGGLNAAALRYRVTPGVSWSAILAGAAVSLALSLLLAILAAGFGMQISLYALASRASLGDFTPAVGAWAVVAQVVPAALGGYLAGRLRHGWHGVADDESHFRDTAQGLISWAVSALVGVLFVAVILAPYADHLAAGTLTQTSAPGTAADLQRAANISAQASYFAAVGMLLSAFVSAVAGRLGGLQVEEAHPLA